MFLLHHLTLPYLTFQVPKKLVHHKNIFAIVESKPYVLSVPHKVFAPVCARCTIDGELRMSQLTLEPKDENIVAEHNRFDVV